MKNSQKGNTTILVLIVILLIIGGGIYFYNKQKVEENVVIDDAVATSTVSTTTSIVENTKTLPDSEFLKSFLKDYPQSKVVAKGDVNRDGYQDAIVEYTYCGGSSCTIDLSLVININNKNTEVVMNSNFGPAYQAGTAIKSELTNVSIDKDGTISLMGKGLSCPNNCDEKNWNIIRTVKYKYDTAKGMIQQLSVNPPSQNMKISKGTYTYNEPNGTGANGVLIGPNVYTVTIKNEGASGSVGININFPKIGSANIYAHGVMSGDGVNVVFDSYGYVDNSLIDLYKRFKKGDVLFTIKPTSVDGSILLDWGKLVPDSVLVSGDQTIFDKLRN